MNLRARWPHAQRLGHELKYRVYYVQEWALVVLLALSRFAGGQRKPFEWVSEFSSHSCFERSTQPWAPEGNPKFLSYFQSFFSSFFPNSPRSFWASLLPSLFPYGEFFIPPFDSLGSLFFLSPFGAPDSFTPPLKVLYSSPFPPPQNLMGPFSLTLPFRLCRFIPPRSSLLPSSPVS